MKWLKIGVGGMFFLLPLFFLPPPYALSLNQQLIGAKFILCFAIGNLFFSAYLGNKIHPYFALLHFVMSLGVLMLFNPIGLTQLYPFAYWLAAVGGALLFLELKEEWQEFLLRCVVWGGVASAVMAFFQALDMDPILTYAPTITEADRRLPVGMIGQTTKHGALLAILFGVALGVKERFAAVLILIAAILTKSSFTYLALAGVILVYVRYLPLGKYLVKAGLAVGAWSAACLAFIRPSFLDDNGRFDVWGAAISAWWNHAKVFGFGPGSFEALFPANFQPVYLRQYGDFIQAHNDYVDAIFQFGAFGIIAITAGAAFLFLHFRKFWWPAGARSGVLVASQCGIVAICLNALGNFPFQLAPHYFLAVIFLAVLLGRTQTRYNKV